ncbi:MAG: signal peptidase I [Erysipelotrichaceae bacterium]|jgi:signal peptidase I|nr:signal peptidase I [Erysipelotrichaceae bacterium]
MKSIETKNERNKKIRKALNISIIIISIIAIVGLAGSLFHKFYYTTFYIDGQSMYPTLNAGGGETTAPERNDFGIVDTSRSIINSIKRFDIVTTYFPDDYNAKDELLLNRDKKIKRVIGLPGEKVKTLNRNIYINDEKLSLPYEPGSKDLFTYEVQLDDDEYFLVGDNWGHSKDSTTIGPIEKWMINGVLIAIEGTCVLKLDDYGKIYATDYQYRWPTFYKR